LQHAATIAKKMVAAAVQLRGEREKWRSGRKWKTTDFTDFTDRRPTIAAIDLRRSRRIWHLINLICRTR
jgi:hypothetical protein